MNTRPRRPLASLLSLLSLLLLLLLAACGEAVSAGTGVPTPVEPTPTPPTRAASPTAPAATPATPAATPTKPRGQKFPPPTPDPTAVAAGAPLRATLLDQIAAAEARCAAAPSPSPVATPSPCRILPGQQVPEPQLGAYVGWQRWVITCSPAPGGGGGYVYMAILVPVTTEQLRNPAMLDLYVANTPWCGLRGAARPHPE